jgi:hypothetical protein
MGNLKKDTYKSLPVADLYTRQSHALSSDEATKGNTILTNFFSYFKAKHL